MRQGLALVRGALVATALFAVPACGPAVAHALTLPVHVQVGLGDNLNVSVGGPESAAAVNVGGAAVTVPNVGQSAQDPPPSGPIPQPPALPDPVAGPVQDVTNTGNGVVDGVVRPPSGGSSGSAPQNNNSGNNGGGSGGGGSGGGGGGNGSPNATGGGRTPRATGQAPRASPPNSKGRAT